LIDVSFRSLFPKADLMPSVPDLTVAKELTTDLDVLLGKTAIEAQTALPPFLMISAWRPEHSTRRGVLHLLSAGPRDS
jgi:hypothetical protein